MWPRSTYRTANGTPAGVTLTPTPPHLALSPPAPLSSCRHATLLPLSQPSPSRLLLPFRFRRHRRPPTEAAARAASRAVPPASSPYFVLRVWAAPPLLIFLYRGFLLGLLVSPCSLSTLGFPSSGRPIPRVPCSWTSRHSLIHLLLVLVRLRA